VFAAQEGLSEVLRDEAQLEEQADGAPAQALDQGSGIVDGQVVELPGGVESAFEDKGVEVRVESKRVPEGLIDDGCGGGDWLATGGGVELSDQVEDQPCNVGEQALVKSGRLRGSIRRRRLTGGSPRSRTQAGRVPGCPIPPDCPLPP
jgi:hypothetical protein